MKSEEELKKELLEFEKKVKDWAEQSDRGWDWEDMGKIAYDFNRYYTLCEILGITPIPDLPEYSID